MPDPQKNGYVVLQRFMIDGLGLTGDELIVYAIIYGFCQDGRSSCRCSRSYFAYWIGKSKTTVNRIIDSLVAKGCVMRSHEVVDGQTMPRYLLGASAPAVKLDHLEVVAEEPKTTADGGSACDKGGTPTYPPYRDEHVENSVSAGGDGGTPTYPRYAGEPGVRRWEPITDTDTETDSETDRRTGKNDDLLADFNALKPFMPSTDGFSFGYDNYKALRKRGFTAQEVAEAARRMTKALREDYPDRPAKFFPHAERLLDPDNPQGIFRFLDPGAVAATETPSDHDLFVFAMTSDTGEISRAAIAINDSIVSCPDADRKEALRRERAEWIDEHRDRLIALWRECKRARRAG